LFIEKAKLSIIIEQVLTVAFARDGPGRYHFEDDDRAKKLLVAPSVSFPAAEGEDCKQSLLDWAANVPKDLIYRRPATASYNLSFILNIALLRLVYFASTLSALNCFLIYDIYGTTEYEIKKQYFEKARMASLEIARISQDLVELNLVRYLPTSGVTPITYAAVFLLEYLKSPKEEVQNSSAEGLMQCMNAMQGSGRTTSSPTLQSSW
jgi:hypothetical protein